MNRWFAEDSEAQNKAYHTLEIKDVMPGRYSAIYFAGSDESVMQNHWFRQFSELILSNNGVVAGSGSADNAITRLELSKKIDNGYSLPYH